MSNDRPPDILSRLIKSPNNHCFGCGPGNPHGLHLHFHEHDGVVTSTFTTEQWQEGWEGVIHGGILATLLDESMAYVLYFAGIRAVTARMEVRYRRPLAKG